MTTTPITAALEDTRPLAAVPSDASEVAVTFEESRFTRPREACPHPERWHSVNAEAPESEVINLVAALAEALQVDYAVLCGSGGGYTAEAVGRAVQQSGSGLVDVLEGPAQAKAVRERCEGLPVNVEETPPLLFQPKKPIDLLWLDGRTEVRGYSLARLLPFLSARALIAAHDTHPDRDVRSQFTPLELEGVIRPLYLPTPRGLMLSRVAGGAEC
jgi:hypothetical protein